MKFHPAQSQIAQDKHRFRVVNCGRRFGKTFLAVYEMVAKAVYGDDRKICYIAPTYQAARDITWEILKKITLPVAESVNEARLEIVTRTKEGGHSTIYLKGWEAVETLRGMRFDFIVLDEVASFRNFETGWMEVLRPTLTDTKGEALFISTPKGFNHFYKLFNTVDEDYKSFHFKTSDNPHIPPEEIEKAKQELPENRFYQEYEGSFTKAEGLVFRDFDRARHLTDKAPESVSDTISGIDWGYTNPAASYRIRIDRDRTYWIDREYYKTGQSTESIVEAVKLNNPSKVYADPAEPDRCDIAKRLGLNVREVSKDIEAGLDVLQELFKQNRIKIDRSCENLIYELETYHYPDKKPDQNEKETPVKENDHAIDCIRYAIYMSELNPSYQRTNYKVNY